MTAEVDDWIAALTGGRRPPAGHAVLSDVGCPVMAVHVTSRATGVDSDEEPDSVMFHGAALDSILSLLELPILEITVAARLKIDGPPGFFLATDEADAEFFAARRAPGAVVRFVFSANALADTISAGAVLRAIAGGPPPYFQGHELWIPERAFGSVNALIRSGVIHVSA